MTRTRKNDKFKIKSWENKKEHKESFAEHPWRISFVRFWGVSYVMFITQKGGDAKMTPKGDGAQSGEAIKVLVVEDKKAVCDFWQEVFQNTGLVILWAATLKAAVDLFAANPDVKVVVMDGCLEGDGLDTLPLVRLIRQSFTGPMIATSSLPEYQEQLRKAGCSHESDKGKLPFELLSILGL